LPLANFLPVTLFRGVIGPTVGAMAEQLRTSNGTQPADPSILSYIPRGGYPRRTGSHYVVSEALTNAAKHTDATAAHVAVHAHDGVLELSVRDDGRGGADVGRGSGPFGLVGRVDTTIEVTGPIGGKGKAARHTSDRSGLTGCPEWSRALPDERRARSPRPVVR
jgi:hypothetical protein